jgi:hypothetical protein
MRHKQILDVAAERPDASSAEIATDVPSATPDLVERVLDEYGDPAEDEVPADTEYPAPDELTDKQVETLRAIAGEPTASQRDLAETLSISAATVSTRVNTIDGFDWAERETFVEAVLGTASLEATIASTAEASPNAGGEETDAPSTNDATTDRLENERIRAETTADLAATVEQLDERLARVEKRLDDLAEPADGEANPDAPLADSALVHKVVHACMDADTISEDEELRILQALLE